MKKSFGGTLIKALAVISALVVIFNTFRLAATPNTTRYAKTGRYSNSVDAEGYLVKSESVAVGAASGIMEASVAEGSRVRAGQVVGTLVTGDVDSQTAAELEELSGRIESIKKSMSESGVLMIDDSKVASALEQSLAGLKYAAAKNNVKSLTELAGNIKTLNERRAGLTSSVAAEKNLQDLQSRRDALSASLGGVRNEIRADISGLYSENVDGLETVLTVDALQGITPAKIASFDTLAEGAVPTGPCKIVNNFKWYIACTLPADELEGLETGKSYKVIFKESGGKEISGTITYISEADENGNAAVVMSFKDYLENFTSLRKTKIEIVKARFSGIYIPVEALRVKDGITGVYVQNERTPVFKSISIVYRSEDFLLADPDAEGTEPYDNIKLYDKVVIDPEDE